MSPGARRGGRRASAACAVLTCLALLACQGTKPTGPSASPAPPTGTAASPLVAPSGAAGVSLGPSPAPATPVPTLTPTLAERLGLALRTLRGKDHLPGVQAVVSFGDGWTWAAHAGYANVSRETPVSNSSLFEAGSITKTFVAALTLELADQGVLSLDDPLTRWLPDFPHARGVTLRELLDHTSGLDDFFAHPTLLDRLGAEPRRAWTPAEVLRYVGAPHFAPGRGYYYSNTNYVLLGQVIERATGRSVASLLRTRFFQPLGLDHTFLQSEEPVVGTPADGYGYAGPRDLSFQNLTDGSSYLPFTSLATAAGTAGSLVSTASDLARWAVALYGGRVLPPAALAQMEDVAPTARYRPPKPYGLGVERLAFGPLVSWGHDGRLSGYRAAMRYFPAQNLTIVVMTNIDGPDPDSIVAGLLKTLYPASAGRQAH